MKALSDLIIEKEEKLEIQGVTAKPMNELEVKWVRTKNYVDKLQVNYRGLLEEALENRTWKIKKIKTKKYIIIELEKYVEERVFADGTKTGLFRVIAEIREEEKAVVKVTYYAFNHIEGTAYIRKVIGE